jgi:predicted RNA-binding protein with PUA-like domain
MSGWLFKIEPGELSITDLAARGARGVCWDGVRNYQARNMLRDQIKVDDKVFIYHSSCADVGIAGIARVIRAAYPDPSQFDVNSKYFDAGSKPEQPRWISVDVCHEKTFDQIIPLAVLKANSALAQMPLVQRGNRLSVMPVTAAEWKVILTMSRD